jgi:hypothetical protein
MSRTRTRIATGIMLDTGALIALDRGDKRMIALLRLALAQGRTFRVPAGVVAQAWRDGRVQVTLARWGRQCVGYYRCFGGDPRQAAARPHSHKRSE